MLAARSSDQSLPALRETLRLVPCSHSGDPDAADHMIVDPVRHQYVRVSKTLLDVFSAWRMGTIPALIDALAARNVRIDAEDVERAVKFAYDNQLTVEPEKGGWRAFAGLADANEKSPMMQAAHTYVSFRVPIMQPEPILRLLWPFLAFMFTRAFVAFVACLAVIGLFLVQRQWDVFIHSFSAFLTFEGLVASALALVFVKTIHELGHAFMAHKYGVPVPQIGAAFIVLFPILYTDTTAAWTLSRRQRLMVDSAGIFAELTLAVFATIAWVFLPDGSLRDVAFVVATISWLMSLVINLNPLMRFDGYYILADATGVENLQSRGFALARWQLREWLFGFGEPVPERFSSWAHSAIIFHAFCVWVYRFFLFLGIALLVYHKTAKALGIILFVVEIFVFIGRPVAMEVNQWIKRRGGMAWNRQSLRTVAMLVGLLVLLFTPLSIPIHVPAVAGAGHAVALHPHAAGLLVSVNVREGQTVQAGDVLFEVTSPDFQHERVVLQRRESLLQHRIARSTADLRDRSELLVLRSELDAIQNSMRALNQRAENLRIIAPADGVIRNLGFNLAPGQWIAPTERLALLVAGQEQTVTGYVAAERLRRIQSATHGVFMPDEPELAKVPIVIAAYEVPSKDDGRLAALLDIYGGRIVSEPPPTAGERAAPAKPHYRVSTVLDLDDQTLKYGSAIGHEVHGILRIWPEAESFAVAIARRVAGVLIRESGF